MTTPLYRDSTNKRSPLIGHSDIEGYSRLWRELEELGGEQSEDQSAELGRRDTSQPAGDRPLGAAWSVLSKPEWGNVLKKGARGDDRGPRGPDRHAWQRWWAKKLVEVVGVGV